MGRGSVIGRGSVAVQPSILEPSTPTPLIPADLSTPFAIDAVGTDGALEVCVHVPLVC